MLVRIRTYLGAWKVDSCGAVEATGAESAGADEKTGWTGTGWVEVTMATLAVEVGTLGTGALEVGTGAIEAGWVEEIWGSSGATSETRVGATVPTTRTGGAFGASRWCGFTSATFFESA